MFLTHIEQELMDEGTWAEYYREGGFADPDYAQEAEDRELLLIQQRLDAEYGKAVYLPLSEDDLPY